MAMLLLLLTHATLASAADPTIFWVSEPLAPGDAAVIAFASPPALASAAPLRLSPAPAPDVYARQGSGAWAKLHTEGPTAYGITAVVPTTFTLGEFEVRFPLSANEP